MFGYNCSQKVGPTCLTRPTYPTRLTRPNFRG